MSEASDASPPLRFNNEAKLRRQMVGRGWTDETIRQALATVGVPTTGKRGAATRYVHPVSGKSIVVVTQAARYSTWAEKDSDMTSEIYMPLLDEGVNVWRPAPAWKIDDRTYIVLRPEDYDIESERWKFPPGSTVDCEMRQTSNGNVLAAVRLHASRRRTA